MQRTDAVAVLGARTRDRIDAIVDDLMERQWYEVPDFWVTDDPAFHEAVLRSTRENTELMLDLVARPGPPPRELCPGARLEANVAAQFGARADALLHTYAVGEHALAEYFIEVIESGEIENAPAALRELRAALRVVRAYMGAVMPLVGREHADERERITRHPDLRRLRLVQAALAGDGAAALDYPVDARHVAIVTVAEHAEAALGSLAGALGVPLLAVRAPDGRCWAWLAEAPLGEVTTRLRAAGLKHAAGVGGPASFRTAHTQAALGERVARGRDGAAVVDLRSAALEVLFLGDRRTAAAVARAELGPLAGPAGGRHAHLRRTLEAWFASRENVGATAEALQIAPRTVSYRLRRAETLLGHPIAARRAELEAALRIERLCADE